jgi:protein SCO1/2
MTTSPPESTKRRGGDVIGIAVIFLLLIGIVAIMALRPGAQPAQELPAGPTATFAPSVPGVTPIEPPRAVADFTMPAALPGGEVGELSLSQLEGKHTLVFFGYTRCPDFCPITLAEFVQIKRALGDQAEQLQFLFVSVDGDRDTPESIRAYLDGFDPTFIGMSGVQQTLEPIRPDFGLYYDLRTNEGRGDNYLVDHSTPSYLIDPQRRLAAIYSYDANAGIIAADIAERLAS